LKTGLETAPGDGVITKVAFGLTSGAANLISTIYPSSSGAVGYFSNLV